MGSNIRFLQRIQEENVSSSPSASESDSASPPPTTKKRSKSQDTTPKKKLKSSPVQQREQSSDENEDEEPPSKTKDTVKSPPSRKPDSKQPSVSPVKEKKKKKKAQKEPSDSEQATGGEADDASESEMSLVYDEEPKAKNPKKGTTNITKSQPKPPKQQKSKPKTKAKDSDPDDPNQAEIKRLQGWLVKCGIRKMWYRELAPFSTPKDKIRHLRDMLKDAGMEGRYSMEKAKRIREERELQADLEVVQEGARLYGTGSEQQQPRTGRVPRGRDSLAFLGSDNGEEESD